jgi:acyl-CoA synthetase (AMP-forming)/AMP-acid ligase II
MEGKECWEGPSIDLVEQAHRLTLADFVIEVCARHGDREALVFDDPLRGHATVRWTYSDLERQSRAVAAALIRRGVGLGTRVALVLGNRPEMVAAIFGIALAGGVAVPVSTFASPPELKDILVRSAAAGVMTQSKLLDRDLAAEISRLACSEEVPFLGWCHLVDEPGWPGEPAAGEARRTERRRHAVSPGDPGLILFSSGTTSEPKGMVHVHRAPTLQFWLLADVFRRQAGSRVWAPLPLFWTAGLTTALGPTLAGGGCFVLQETFDAGKALSLLQRERVTEPYTLPHQAAALAEHDSWAATDLSALREVYGKSVFTRHPSVAGDTTWTMPVGYGMSETCGTIVSHRWDNSRQEMKASTGRLLPGSRLKVVDPDTGALLGADADGELAVAGPTVIDRYVGKTREESLDPDGFLRTGDVGYVDADGAVHWTGRRTEMIKTGGANVSPAELEFALRACPDVRRAKVVGLPDGRLGEVVVLCVEPSAAACPTERSLKDFLAARLASYKVPRHVLFFAPGEMPSTSGDAKIRDSELIALAAARLGKLRLAPPCVRYVTEARSRPSAKNATAPPRSPRSRTGRAAPKGAFQNPPPAGTWPTPT